METGMKGGPSEPVDSVERERSKNGDPGVGGVDSSFKFPQRQMVPDLQWFDR